MTFNGFKLATAAILALPMIVGSPLTASAQQSERRVVLSDNADYFGNDYDILKEVTLDQCSAQCAEDRQCRAFTYNISAAWCFLKNDVGELRAVDGAVSGRIVETAQRDPAVRETRRAELDFIGQAVLDSADQFATALVREPAAGGSVSEWIDRGAERRGAEDQPGAVDAYRKAVGIAPDNFRAWAFLARSLARSSSQNWQQQRRLREDAVSASVNAYLNAATDDERAIGLARLGSTLGASNQWKTAIRSYRASLALNERDNVRQAYDRAVAAHGFRLLEHRVDSDAAAPQICLVLSDDLAREGVRPEEFLRVVPDRDLAIEAKTREICIDGVRHGERYAVTLRDGLPAADGEKIEKSIALDIFVRDRKPSVRFPGTAYVLPGHYGATIPVVTVNTGQIEADLFRIGDRALARTIGDGRFLEQLNQYDGEEIVGKSGVKVWSGTVDVDRSLNEEIVSAIAVKDIAPTLEPGAYALVAKAPSDVKPWEAKATQWFVVTDLGLTALSGNDGFRVMARSLTKASPLAGLDLRLVAVNNEVLGTATTDDEGFARFDPGLVRGSEGMAPALVVAESQDGDYAFLDLKGGQLDLTDRGVEGRDAPGPVDVFMTTERGIYRPGETVYVTSLVRNGRAEAITDLPLTMIVRRPDGKEEERRLISPESAGGSLQLIALGRDAMRGAWRVGLHTDPDRDPLTDLSFLVEDFLPERLDFDIESASSEFGRDTPLAVSLAARFLYGAPASGLDVYGTTTLAPNRALTDYPNYVFGLADEAVSPVSSAFDAAQTDGDGAAILSVALPDSPSATVPLDATIAAQVIDTSGRPVERRLTLPVESQTGRLGLRPLFEGAAGENSTVQFAAIAIDTDGSRTSAGSVSWTLSKVETDYQWYRSDGRWNYETIDRKRRVASGTIEVGAGDPSTLDVDVAWGGYELTLEPESGGIIPVSHRFEAGWYVERRSLDSPEALKVALDKPAYRIGETVEIHVTPPFAGSAQILVVDDRVIETRQVEIPEEGATISLAVTEEWGAGAYVTALVYRPMDVGNKRMPARAVGLAWAGVDPGPRRLRVAIEGEDVIRPRQSVPITLSVENGTPGDTAYITLAAVDAGILNLTGFETPAPDEFYFGQRQLGVGLTDFYNKLIDRMQGTPGRVRSGGDASAMRFEGPPPPDTLMAFHSGIETIGPDGTVTIDVPVPDFNGTIRLMAMAWSADGIGHAEREIIARDPVVMAASLPRFLAPGDQSRILVDLADVEGVGGGARLAVSGTALSLDARSTERTLEFTDGDRQTVLVPVTANGVGDGEVTLDLTLADGTILTKTVPVGVRDNEPPVRRTSDLTLAAGQSVTLSSDLIDGLRPGTGSVSLSATGAGRLDLVGIVRSLDRYPYGCAEQLTSRALPLLYLDEILLSVGLSGDESVRERVQKAIGGVLAYQNSSGGFGLWSPASADLWLESYVTDFLSRARDKGYTVPDQAFSLALDNLKNRLAYIPDFDFGGQDVAYAFYILARHGQAAISDLRYYAGAKLDTFATPLAKAQLAAALALYGDQARADAIFRVALGDLTTAPGHRGWRSDYGSGLRDRAAVVTLAVESGTDALDPTLLVNGLDAAWRQSPSHSTQEEAWSLLAAHALSTGAQQPSLSLNGERRDGPVYADFNLEALADGIIVENLGDRPVQIAVSARGAPTVPEPAGGTIGSITRAYYTLDGSPADLTAIGQGERLVAVVSVLFADEQRGQIIIDDPLPAGFEIDNPNLLQSGEVAALDWLRPETSVAHREFRADRFIASVDRAQNSKPRLDFAYIVRAVSPGSFAHPAALVQDMYRPERMARTAPGRVDVIGPLR